MKKSNVVVSPKWKLVWPDIVRLLRGAMYTAVGSAAAYAMTYVQALDFGEYQMFLAIPISALVYLLKQLITHTEYMLIEQE